VKEDLQVNAVDAITQSDLDSVRTQIHAFKFIACSAGKNENMLDLAISAVLSQHGSACNIAEMIPIHSSELTE
jgi:hypothetical protein